MKKIVRYIHILSLAACLYSCDNLFYFGDDGTLTYENVFSDYALTGKYLNTCYSYMPNFANSSAGGTFLAVFTDEAQDADDVLNSSAMKYYNGGMSSANNLLDSGLYDQLWNGIRACNIFLANIDNVPNMRVEEHRSKWKGEALVLRAYYYLQLIKRFGPMPIIKNDLPLDYDYSQVSRPSFYENVKEIIDDCDKAIQEEHLPMRVTLETDNGSVTKAMAYAIKSQAMLYAASPLWNDGNDYWAEALEQTKEAKEKLIEAGFDLFDPSSLEIQGMYGKYQEYFLTKPELVENPSRDKETIYSQKGNLGTLWKNYGLPMMPDVTTAGLSPSQELVDAYETIDGQPVLDMKMPYLDSDHLQPNYNPKALKENGGMYDPENPYANRDPRLRSNIICNGDYQNQKDNTNLVETFVGGNCGLLETSQLYTRTGYYLRKFINYQSDITKNLDGYWRYFRMAEIYLNFAEASFYANNSVTSEALEAVDKVRVRAGMPKLPKDISSEEFELRLRNERRVEFAFEEHRYFDTRRWKISTEVEPLVTGMRIEKEDDGTFSYNRFVVQNREVNDDKYMKWPIPLTEQNKFDVYGIHFQNEGW